MKNRLLFLSFAVVLSAQVALAQQSKTDPSLEFNPHWFGQIQGGAAYTIGETSVFKDLLSPAAALSFGYQFTPASKANFLSLKPSKPANSTRRRLLSTGKKRP